jgi:hypothetical protein
MTSSLSQPAQANGPASSSSSSLLQTVCVWISQSLLLTGRLLQTQWLPLTLILVFGCAVNLFGEDFIQPTSSSSASRDDNLRLVLQLLIGVEDLLESVVTLLVLCWAIPKVRGLSPKVFLPEPFAQPYLSSFLAEYLRMLAQIMMWAILLLIPGFIRYCQLIFVPLVAIFSKDYRLGQADAIKLSQQLMRGRLGIIMAISATSMALQGGLEFLPQMVPEVHTSFFRVLFYTISFLISIWTFGLVFLLFEKAALAREVNHV